jgi:putative oxidoreductase
MVCNLGTIRLAHGPKESKGRITFMKPVIENCHRMLNRGAGALQSPFLLLIRLYWGWQFIETGWGKINNIPKVTGFFTILGLPFPGVTAHFIAGLEFLGGILLVLGLASRLIALPLTINMLVAYITADREALFSVISDPDKFYAAAPYTFLVASLIVLIFGPGKFALDAWVASRRGSTWDRGADAASRNRMQNPSSGVGAKC